MVLGLIILKFQVYFLPRLDCTALLAALVALWILLLNSLPSLLSMTYKVELMDTNSSSTLNTL